MCIRDRQYGAGKIVEAKKYAVGAIKDTFEKYRALKNELPAMGYSPKQIKDLEMTINRAECDIVISATPINIRHLINANKPIVQISYEIQPRGKELDAAIERFVNKKIK